MSVWLNHLQDAKRDEVSRRAYKLLATLHSDCSELVKMVEETGANVRESRDLEDQVILFFYLRQTFCCLLILDNKFYLLFFRLKLKGLRVLVGIWKEYQLTYGKWNKKQLVLLLNSRLNVVMSSAQSPFTFEGLTLFRNNLL